MKTNQTNEEVTMETRNRVKKPKTCKCTYCRTKYMSYRSDTSVFCSNKCRQAAYRERVEAKNAGHQVTKPDAPTQQRNECVNNNPIPA